MTWTDQQWGMFFELLDKGWPGDLDEGGAEAYRVLLGDIDPQIITAGVRRLLMQGARFRPSAAEILGAARHDPGRPSFAEALVLIRHALVARPPRGARYDDDPEPEDDEPRPRGWRSAERKRSDAEHGAVTDRLAAMHPLVAAFAQRQGIDRLKRLQLDDPEWGEKRRADLEASWDEHVDTFSGREVAALAAGERRETGLQRLDPLAAIGIAPPQPQLEAGPNTTEIEEAA